MAYTQSKILTKAKTDADSASKQLNVA